MSLFGVGCVGVWAKFSFLTYVDPLGTGLTLFGHLDALGFKLETYLRHEAHSWSLELTAGRNFRCGVEKRRAHKEGCKMPVGG